MINDVKKIDQIIQQISDNNKKFLEMSEKIKCFKEIDNLKIEFLGKNSLFVKLNKQLKELPPIDRPIIGKTLNEFKLFVDTKLEKLTQKSINNRDIDNNSHNSDWIDISINSKIKFGHRHPISIIQQRFCQIFYGLGFDVVEGPEIEDVYHNFDALNVPPTHPSRSELDSFYINDGLLLRTETSTVQIRTMESRKPPIRMISTGKVYRRDSLDATHSPVFHQLEGLLIDKGVSFANLKHLLSHVIKEMFGQEIQTRFRPHHFPFTEPSAEIDITCPNCNGSGCSTCKYEGLIEILGAGMVHPNVLKSGNISPEEYSGFAFAFGLERVAMRIFDIPDIRLFYENDIKFLTQY